ncbi:hypothetical protein NQF86_08965 [Bombella sp. TMW 2.2543]|uniref:Phosphate starvation-inducible protein PsiF n=1 Tax=Bombella pluederhausensis TaxID=2967336 RepID=A0ABT3WI94_9PROT|nr:hypothetical protein [Bombella pluederhausensis]MCX5618786.1 hypothetical protein [Bombella pluederhausensis]
MMFRRMAAFALIASALTSQAAFAAHSKAHHCRNEKGQFTKCEKQKAKPCRDQKGKFTKCASKDKDSKPAAEATTTAPDTVKDSTNPMKSDMPAPGTPAPAATPAP